MAHTHGGAEDGARGAPAERGQAHEQPLDETEHRFRLMADAVPQIVWVTDADGRVEFFNKQWADYTGVPYEPTTAAAVAATFVHPDDGAATVAAFDEARRTGSPFAVEHRIRSAAGDYRWFLVRAEPYRDPATGAIVRWFGASVDIHDRQAIEAALRASEARQAFLLALQDRLLPLTDADAIQFEAARALGEHLGASRVGYAEIEADGAHSRVTRHYTQDALSIEGRYRVADYSPALIVELRAGRTVARNDVATDAGLTDAERAAHVALRVGASVDLPLVRGGRLVAVLFAHFPAPHAWTAEELTLLTDVAARTWDAVERARAEVALEAERARLADVVNVAPAFMAVLRGPDHVITLTNLYYDALVGHRPVRGRPVAAALPEAAAQGFVELLDHVLATGEPFVGREVPYRRPDVAGVEEERYVNFVYQALVEARGTRTGVLVHGVDVTDQVHARREVERLLAESEHARVEAEAARAEGERAARQLQDQAAELELQAEELQATAAQLEERTAEAEEARRLAEVARATADAANQAKGQFLAVMSHELRTPLNAIGGYAELIEIGIRGPVTAEQREDLRRLQASQRHLLGLINEVLNYAKLETGAVHYDLVTVPVHDALAGAEALVAPQALTKGLTLVVADCPPELAVRADAEKLRQVLVNLVSNAIKFTDCGGRITLACAPAASQDASQVAFTVHDTGLGIPANKLDAIFDPFVQVRADLTRPHEGTGLGLAISRDLARGMGGNLTVESTPGAGSTFTLSLPSA
jgi:PAS domain S-box-containing protein